MQVPTVFTTALILLFSTAEAEVVGSVTIGTTGEVNNSFKFYAIQTKVVFLQTAYIWRQFGDISVSGDGTVTIRGNSRGYMLKNNVVTIGPDDYYQVK